MQTVCTVAGWAEIPQQLLTGAKIKALARQLSVVVRSYDGEPSVLECYKLSNGVFKIPRAYFMRANHTLPYEISVSPGADLSLKSTFTPRSQNQSRAVEALVSAFNTDTLLGGILKAPPGFGKTAVACEVISQVGKTALVVVHKEFLVNQWREQIARFLPAARVGIVQQDKCELDCDISIAMIQSLTVSNRVYPDRLFSWPGLVIFDEVHRIGAPIFSRAAPLFKSKFRLGLSATPWRSDGADSVFFWHIGSVLYDAGVGRSPSQKMNTPQIVDAGAGRLSPQIVMVKTGVRLNREIRAQSRVRSRGILLSILAHHRRRNAFIANWLKRAAAKERRVLVLSERLVQLRELASRLTGQRVGFYIGGRSRSELAEAAKASIILATYQMAMEGLDIPALDTLFMATPIASHVSLEQAIGRILRDVAGKKQPVVVDFADDIDLCKEMVTSRLVLYSRKGWEVKWQTTGAG